MTPARSRPHPLPDPAPDPPAEFLPAESPAVAALLRASVKEAVRLLEADGALVYLLRPGTDVMDFAAEASAADLPPGHWMLTFQLAVGAGVFGLAVAERRVVVTPDYANDTAFAHTPATDKFVRESGMRSLVAAPMVAGDEAFGAFGAFSRERDAFTPAQIALVRALADHAALAMANARLIAELDRARLATTRQADVERSLRELGTRISGARDPSAVLQHTIDEARRLLGGDGGLIDILDPVARRLEGVYTSGREILESEWPADPDDSLEVGVSGRAVTTGRTAMSSDYLADTTFVHGHGPDTYVRLKGIRSAIASPLPGGEGPFGAITVWSVDPDAFDADDAVLLETIAGQAAVALGRARLIEELGRSREALARRADEERALRELARRAMTVGDPVALLDDVAGEAARLLGTAGAEIDLLGPAATDGRGARGAGVDPEVLAAWRLAGGSAWIRRAVDERRIVIEAAAPSSPGPIRSFAIAPLLGDAVVWGTLTVFAAEPDRFGPDEAELLAALADHAALALASAGLHARLEASEERYRGLVENSPDIVFTCAADGTFTYVSESVEAILGWTPAEVVGRHFRDLVPPHADGTPAGFRYAALAADPTARLTTRTELVTAGGGVRPVEVSVVPIVRDGVFVGIHGSARDVAERERLERDLRESEARYRYLVQSSPDLVWMTDADGRLTFLSDRARPVIGWDPADAVGRSFADLAPTDGRRAAIARFEWLRRHPVEAHRSRLRILGADARERLVEVTGIGLVAGGRFAGAHGAARDIGELDRLEADLRRQAAELAASEERAHLARELHDSVTQSLFSMTLQSRSMELLLARDPALVADKLTELRELQRDALAEMRALIFELRPGNVAEHGVAQALRTHAAGLSGRIGLPIVVESDLDRRPPIEIEEALYRIAQEALHNVVKHAGARQVRVELGRRDGGVRVRVQDDGHGFDPATVADGHLGLAGMRARAQRLGGLFAVASALGEGTVVEAVIPEPDVSDVARDGASRGVGSAGTGRRR